MMDKQERKLKGKLKYLKRLRNNNIDKLVINNGRGFNNRGVQINFNCYRTTGTPCSCAGCSPGKIKEKAKYRLNKFNKHNFNE